LKGIFKQNALIATGYTVFFIIIFILCRKTWQGSVALLILFYSIGIIHFMIMGIFMAINHFKSIMEKRNGYMAAFFFIWLMLLLGNIAFLYIT